MKTPRVLIAGVGNIFLGDDGFGVEVARRLVERGLPDDVRIIDYGIRGIDLAFALLDPYEAVILVDAMPRGGAPGTLYVLEPDVNTSAPVDAMIEMHNLDPVKVIRTAQSMGAFLQRMLVVGCEPAPLDEAADIQVGLSAPVQASVEEAVKITMELVQQILEECPHLSERPSSALTPDRPIT